VTDRIAIILGMVVLAAIAADVILNDSAALLFLIKKLFNLVEYVAIWR
jgi:hypothetical protein